MKLCNYFISYPKHSGSFSPFPHLAFLIAVSLLRSITSSFTSLPASPALTSEFRVSSFIYYAMYLFQREYARPTYFAIGSKTKQVSSAKFTREHNHMLNVYLVATLQRQWLASTFLNKNESKYTNWTAGAVGFKTHEEKSFILDWNTIQFL